MVKAFNIYKLQYNHREIKKIEISKELDGAFAVIDIDILRIDENGSKNHWKGRTCKIYTKIGDNWKMIIQIGVLEY
jgi:ketosteroid isomerase-like protein